MAEAEYPVVQVDDDVLVQLVLATSLDVEVRHPLGELVTGLAVDAHDGCVLTLLASVDVVPVGRVGLRARLAAQGTQVGHLLTSNRGFE